MKLRYQLGVDKQRVFSTSPVLRAAVAVLFFLFPALLFTAPAFSGLAVNEGFDDFHLGRRPAGWIFKDCNDNADVYTTTGNYGQSPPSIKLSQNGAAVTTETFPASDPNTLSFWIKGMGGDVTTSSLIVQEYYSTWTNLTTIEALSTSGTTRGPFSLSPQTTRLRFTYNKIAGDLALDDVRVSGGTYMRVYYLAYNNFGTTGRYGQIIYAELPGPDGILGTTDDRNVLYDGGYSSSTTAALAQFLDSKIGVGGTIHYVVLSHHDEDHYKGLLMAAGRYDCLHFYGNVNSGYNSVAQTFYNAGAEIHYYSAGNYLSGPRTNNGPGWDPRVEARVLAALGTGTTNTDSGVIQVRNRDSVFLWGGDATGTTENYVLNNHRDELALTDIFAVHHHGANTDGSNGQTFLNQMAPKYAIVPVAFGSTSNHPTQEAMNRINNTGAILYRNDLDYHVEVRCDDSGNYEITRRYAWNGTYTSDGDLVSPPPPFVTGLTVRAETVDHVVLGWNATASGDKYLVHRSRWSGGDGGAGWALQTGMAPGQETGIYERLTNAAVFFTTFTDTSAIPGITYYYRVATVKSYSSGGYSTTQERRWSNEVAAARFLFTPTPTPEGYKTPTPTPTHTPSPTRTPTPTPTTTPTPTPEGYHTPSPTPPPTPTPPPPAVIFSENFDYGLPGDWMVVDGYGDGNTWTDTNPGGRSNANWNPPFMIVDSDWAGERPMDEELITPPIVCSGYENVRLSFNHYFRYWYADGPEKGDVDIRTGGGEWQNLVRFTSSNSGVKQYDISGYADGQPDVQIRWRYYDAEWEWYWGIDNVLLTGTIRITPTPIPTSTPTPLPLTPTPTPIQPTPVPVTGGIWYLPAGGTMVEGRSFDTYILIANPGDTAAEIDIMYVGTDQAFGSNKATIPAGARYTENMKDFAPVGAGRENVAAIVRSLNDVPVIVERAMYFPAGGGGAGWIGSHNTIGLSTTGINWFLAEGATHSFNQFVHILNPNTTAANVTVTFFNENADTWPINHTLGGRRLWTVKANDLAEGQGQLSARVTSDQPVAVDRTMYWPKGGSGGWQDGHATIGVKDFANEWFLPEGATHIFNEFVLVANPSSTTAANVTFTFSDQGGNSWVHNQTIQPQRRQTVNVNSVVDEASEVSTRVSSNIPVAAERAMYWPKGAGAAGWTGGHVTVGVSAPALSWQLPEGSTHIFDEYVLVYNPSEDQAANVAFTFRDQSAKIWTHNAVVQPQRRHTVKVNNLVGSLTQVSTTVKADIPVVAERAMYLPPGGATAWRTGHVTVGVAEP